MTVRNELPPGLYICRVADVREELRPPPAMERWTLIFVVSHVPHAGKVAAVLFMLGRRWLAKFGLQDKRRIDITDLRSILQLVRVQAKGNCLVDATPEELARIAKELLGAEELLSQSEAVESYREVMAEQLARQFGSEQR